VQERKLIFGLQFSPESQQEFGIDFPEFSQSLGDSTPQHLSYKNKKRLI
jgi:hypothetical protein